MNKVNRDSGLASVLRHWHGLVTLIGPVLQDCGITQTRLQEVKRFSYLEIIRSTFFFVVVLCFKVDCYICFITYVI